MKQPTTEYSIEIQEKAQITRDFLVSEKWNLVKEYPLFENYEHSKNSDVKCTIGLYGSFSIVELHWCNKTPEKEFTTLNKDLTVEDYRTIIKLLKINI